MKLYRDFQYGSNRVNTTIVMYEGKPHQIIDIDNLGRKLISQNLISGRKRILDWDPKKLDITPQQLGYVNLSFGEAQYICRKPMRQDWKQGLRDNNTGTPKNNRSHFEVKAVTKALMNDYPDLEECYEFCKMGGDSMAFSKNFCLSHGLKVMYKGWVSIGTVTENMKIEIEKGKEWIEQALQNEVKYVY